MKRAMINIYRLLGIAACVVALVFNTGLSKGTINPSIFTYYTILSNILVLAYFVLSFTPVSRCQWFRGATGIAILLTMLVYTLILAPEFFAMADSSYKPYSFADCMVHIVVPCMMLLDTLFLAKKGSFKWHYPLTWTVFPLMYLVYAMVRGAITGKFPYFFVDYPAIGVKKVVIYCSVITVAYIAIGYLIVLWNKFIGRSLRAVDKC